MKTGKIFSMVGGLVLAIVCVVLASDQGVAGNWLAGFLAGLLGGIRGIASEVAAESAVAIVGAIIALVVVPLVRVALERVPTRTRGVVSKIVWAILAKLFGPTVREVNNRDAADDDDVRDRMRQEVEKRYPDIFKHK